MAILNWDGLSHYDFKMKAKITEWLNGKAEKVHTHTKSEVGLDQVDNTADVDKPISTAQKKKFDAIDTAIAGKSSTGHKHTKSDITDFPVLGTASAKDVASTGNASSTQVVMGNDSRLTDARKASDVQAWAKAENKPSYTKLEVGLGNVDNTSDTNKPVSTAQQTAIDTAYVNANKYTDKKVADLIGTAPETMDTLEEVAAAIQENKDVEKALNEAIGKKANQTELDTHTGNSTIHITASERTKWNAAKTHADSTHARTDATKVTKSTTNGNIKINDVETTVYTHPSSHSIAEVSGLQTALDGKGTYSKPSGGIPKSDLASAVQTSLGKADTALQSHQDISGKQDKSTAVTHKASTAVGSTTQPVYIASDGSATATTYTLGKSVPSDAKFTDTNTVTNLGTASNNYTNGNILIQGSGATSVTKSGNTITISSTDNNTVYTHPTTAGNKHIPSGGKSGQILRWSADGTASWGDDNNTWRGIQDNLLSTSTTDSLSANQGKILNETKMPHKTITTATDFNTLTDTCIYHIKVSNNTNAPSHNHGTLYVDYNVGTPYQIYFCDGGSINAYKRWRASGAWTGWTELKLTDTTYSDATTSAHGLMTAAMVTKLNGIASGANKTTVDSELSSTSTNPVQNKVINTALAGKANSSHGNHVPATQTANNATFLRNDNTWAKVTPANIGAQSAGSYYTESEMDTKLNSKLNTSLKGSVNGLAELDSTGKVPSAQLPSFVDDVIEGYLSSGKFYKESAHTTQITGESGKIYIDLSTEKTYRWSGSAFVVISDTIALGETSTTAYRGDRGKVAYDHSQSAHARTDATNVAKSTTNGNIKINGTETTVYTHPSGTNPHGTTKSDVGLGNVDNTADANKSVKYATSAGSAGWATKATAIVDYNQTSKNIQIGYAGDGIKGDAIKFIAGYTEGNGSDVTAKIKDVSKDALKSWLGLGSLAYSSASIPSVGNGTITITQNGTSKGSFTMNQSGNTTIALTDTNTDTNTVTNIGTAANNYTNGNILFQGSGATTVSKSGNTITISSTDTTYTLAGLMGSTAKGSSDYGVYWNGSSFVQTKHIPTVDNSATFTSGNPAASAAIMTNVLEHTMWLEKHVAISSYGTTTLCNLADQAASHTSGAYLVLISGMTSSCKSEIYLIYNMQNNNKTFYMQQVASAGGSSTACTLTISGTTLTATVQGNSAPYRNIFVFRCTI